MNVSRMRKKQTHPLIFSGFKKKSMINLMQHLERYTNTLPAVGFNSGRYDKNLINSNLIPNLINEKEIEPSVINKANDFVSFKFASQHYEVFGWSYYFRLFSKSSKSQWVERIFYIRVVWYPQQHDEQQLPSHDDFYSKLMTSNPLDKEYDGFQKLLNTGLTEEQALKKLRLKI